VAAVTQDPEAWARLGAKIREQREALGMSRRQLSEVAGVSEKSIQVAEEGRTPRARWPQSLRLIEAALRWEPDSMLRILDGGEPGSRLDLFSPHARVRDQASLFPAVGETESEGFPNADEEPLSNHARSKALARLPRRVRAGLEGVLSFGRRARDFGADEAIVQGYEEAVEALIIDLTGRPAEFLGYSRDPGHLARWQTAMRMDPMLRRTREDRVLDADRERRQLRGGDGQGMFRLDRHAGTADPNPVVGGTTSAEVLQELRKLSNEVARLSEKVDEKGKDSPAE
jgi:transcriptional regulator with XRE-family HTH domain